MNGTESRYHAYILRLWQAQRGDKFVWRASLHNPYTGERHAFTSLRQLCAFLEEVITRPMDDVAPVPDTGESA